MTIQHGDKVRISNSVNKEEYENSDIGWSPRMDKFIGQEGVVRHADADMARVYFPSEGQEWWWRYEDLTLVEE